MTFSRIYTLPNTTVIQDNAKRHRNGHCGNYCGRTLNSLKLGGFPPEYSLHSDACNQLERRGRGRANLKFPPQRALPPRTGPTARPLESAGAPRDAKLPGQRSRDTRVRRAASRPGRGISAARSRPGGAGSRRHSRPSSAAGHRASRKFAHRPRNRV